MQRKFGSVLMLGITIVILVVSIACTVAGSPGTSISGVELAANKELVRRYYELVNAGDHDRLIELLAPSFVVHTALPDGKTGVAGLVASLEQARSGLPDISITVADLVAHGNTVVARTKIRGTHRGNLLGAPPTGRAIEAMAMDVWRVEGGMLTGNWHLEDTLSMMRQVGAIPSDDADPSAAASPVANTGTVVADTSTLEANKALVRRFDAEIVVLGNLAVADEILAPDFVWHYEELPPEVPPDREGVTVFAGAVRAAFPDVRYDVQDILAEGDRVAVRTILTGTHRSEFFGIPATGRSVTLLIIDIYRIADGRIVELWSVVDDLGFLRQLGIIPDAGDAAEL